MSAGSGSAPQPEFGAYDATYIDTLVGFGFSILYLLAMAQGIEYRLSVPRHAAPA